jgi:hypothetical protein
MSYYSKQHNFYENFQSEIPQDMFTWMESSQYNGKDGQKIGDWTASSSNKSRNFINKSGDANQHPVVKDKILNGKAVLEFSTSNTMEMNSNNDVKFNDYTMIFVSRQLGKSNQRLFIGDGNRLYGYWGNGKERLFQEGWNRIDGTPGSDTDWDIMVIRRKATDNYMRNLGTVLPTNAGGVGLDKLFINNGGCCGGERSDAQVAEFILYNRTLTDDEVVVIETYLAKKWGLQNNMDEKHPAFIVPQPPEDNAVAPVANFPVKFLKLWCNDSGLRPNRKIAVWEPQTTDKEYFFQADDEDSGPLIRSGDTTNLDDPKLSVLQFNNATRLQINKPLMAKEYTMIFVSRQLDKKNQRFIVGRGNKLYGYWAGGKEKLHIDGWVVNEPTPSDSEWDIYTIKRNRKGLNFFSRNGNKIASGTPGGLPLDGIFINSGDGHCCNNETSDGQVAEFLVYNTNLSDDQTTIIENYLIKKWKLYSFLDESHPLYIDPPPSKVINAVAPKDFDKFPVNDVKVWLDAAIFAGKDNQDVSTWPSSTKDVKYSLISPNNKPGKVVDKALNNLPVVEVNESTQLHLNKTLISAEFTLAFVSRQLKKKNGRLIVGKGNRLYGYHNGLKNRLFIEGWISPDNGNVNKPSDDVWDLYVIRRTKKGKISFYRNGARMYEACDGCQFFDGLGINQGEGICCGGEASNGQVAEIIMWNKNLPLNDVITVENYLFKKWGITEIDEFHPLYAAPEIKGEPNAEITMPTEEFNSTFPVINLKLWCDSTVYKSEGDSNVGNEVEKWQSLTKNNEEEKFVCRVEERF